MLFIHVKIYIQALRVCCIIMYENKHSLNTLVGTPVHRFIHTIIQSANHVEAQTHGNHSHDLLFYFSAVSVPVSVSLRPIKPVNGSGTRHGFLLL